MASSDEFMSLRDEALRRMRQMYSSVNMPSQRPEPVSEPAPEPVKKEEPPAPKGILPEGLGGILREFNIDEEKAIVGILMYILYKNGADAKLLLALGYLLM